MAFFRLLEINVTVECEYCHNIFDIPVEELNALVCICQQCSTEQIQPQPELMSNAERALCLQDFVSGSQ